MRTLSPRPTSPPTSPTIAEQGYTIVEDAIEPDLRRRARRRARTASRSTSGSCPAAQRLRGHADRPHLQPARPRPALRAGAGAPERAARSSRACSTAAASSRRCRRSPSAPARRRSRSTPTTSSCPIPKPHPPTVCNTMWALTDFTEANGATRIIPGSHLADRSPDYGAPLRLDPRRDAARRVLVWHGSLWHGGGANTTDERRDRHRHELLRRLHPPAGEPAARHPARRRARASRRGSSELCGYSVYNGLIGHIDKRDPIELLPGRAPAHSMVWDRPDPPADGLAGIDAWPVDHAGGRLASGRRRATARHGEPDRPFALASVTKLLTATAVLVAVAGGACVDLDEPAGPPGSTVRLLLAHASGLPFDGDRADRAPGTRRIYGNAAFERARRASSPSEPRCRSPTTSREAVLEPLGHDRDPPRRLARPTAPRSTRRRPAPLRRPSCCARPGARRRSCSPRPPRRSSPTSTACCPGFGRQDPNPWGLGFELHGHKAPALDARRRPRPAPSGTSARPARSSGSTPSPGSACVVLTDAAFGDWARDGMAAPRDSRARTGRRGRFVRPIGPRPDAGRRGASMQTMHEENGRGAGGGPRPHGPARRRPRPDRPPRAGQQRHQRGLAHRRPTSSASTAGRTTASTARRSSPPSSPRRSATRRIVAHGGGTRRGLARRRARARPAARPRVARPRRPTSASAPSSSSPSGSPPSTTRRPRRPARRSRARRSCSRSAPPTRPRPADRRRCDRAAHLEHVDPMLLAEAAEHGRATGAAPSSPSTAHDARPRRRHLRERPLARRRGHRPPRLRVGPARSDATSTSTSSCAARPTRSCTSADDYERPHHAPRTTPRCPGGSARPTRAVRVPPPDRPGARLLDRLRRARPARLAAARRRRGTSPSCTPTTASTRVVQRQSYLDVLGRGRRV